MTAADSPAATAGAAEIGYAEAADLAVVRRFVCAAAIDLGLPAARADLLTVAVSELATNTLQHTGEGGRVRIWAADGRLSCEVTDGGTPQELGRRMPAADAPRGRGLAIVERICDEVSIAPAPGGMTVRVGMRL